MDKVQFVNLESAEDAAIMIAGGKRWRVRFRRLWLWIKRLFRKDPTLADVLEFWHREPTQHAQEYLMKQYTKKLIEERRKRLKSIAEALENPVHGESIPEEVDFILNSEVEATKDFDYDYWTVGQ